MRLSLSTLFNNSDQVLEAKLMLYIMKRYILRQDYNFAASSEFNRLLWHYFQLEKHYLQSEYWKKDNVTKSANETALEVLTEYYISHPEIQQVPKTKKETGLLQRIILKFYTRIQKNHHKGHNTEGNDYFNEAGWQL